MSDSVQPHRQQPTRLPCPWDSPGKNTGVGCHFLLQCMKVSESEVTQSALLFVTLLDCSLPGSSVHGIFQARVLEWVAVPFSRESSQPRDRTHSRPSYTPALPTSGCEMQTGRSVSTFRRQGSTAKTTVPATVIIQLVDDIILV